MVRVALVVASLAVVAALFAPATPGRVAHGAGCLMARVPDPWQRLGHGLRDSELVLVGVVLERTRVELDAGGGLRPSADQSPGDDGTFRATLRPEALLKGERPAGDLDLPWLTEVWSCGTGPLLREGERVLLLLHRPSHWREASSPFAASWQTALFGGQIALRDGEAYMDDYTARDGAGERHLGAAADVVRELALRLGATEAATEQAVAAATSVSPAQTGEWGRGRFIVGLVLIAVVASLLTAALRYLLRRRLSGRRDR